MKLPARLAERSVTELTRVACGLALIGLALMVYPIVFPGPLAVVLSMSLGHLVGVAAAGFYALAILVDLARGGRMSLPPGRRGPPWRSPPASGSQSESVPSTRPSARPPAAR